MTFYIISALVIVAAVMVVLFRNPVYSALSLVACLFAQAVVFVLMNAHFVAVMQILIYAGAIMVLILFVIMVLNLGGEGARPRAISGDRLVVGVGALYLAGVLGITLLAKFSPAGSSEAGEMAGTVENVGWLMLTKYMMPFEILSALLLVAIVGAVVTGRRNA